MTPGRGFRWVRVGWMLKRGDQYKSNPFGAWCCTAAIGRECHSPQLTDRILTALAPHLSQREPGDSELLQLIELGDRMAEMLTPRFPADHPTDTDFLLGHWEYTRNRIKSAMRGEGKP